MNCSFVLKSSSISSIISSSISSSITRINCTKYNGLIGGERLRLGCEQYKDNFIIISQLWLTWSVQCQYPISSHLHTEISYYLYYTVQEEHKNKSRLNRYDER